MKYFTADYIFPIKSEPFKNGIIITEDDGTIVSVTENYQDMLKLKSAHHELTKLKGFIVPGFINAHCHLELSYLKNQISEGNGLTGFIKEMLAIRNNYSAEIIQQAIIDAEKEMYKNGIVAVADIANDDYTFAKKADSLIYFHTLLEAFDIAKERAAVAFQHCVALGEKLKNTAHQNSNYSIVPHAPYTVTPTLFTLIKNFASKNNAVQSIHNQESEAENQLFIDKAGAIYDFFAGMGQAMMQFTATGKDALQSILPLMNAHSKTLLVHNTFTSKEDVEWANGYNKNLYWCFCPNANLYIEKCLPVFENFTDTNVRCCIGTDSYASNHSLNILDELKTISKYANQIPLSTLLKWATYNGAEYLGIENTFGSLQPGKKPGLNLIEQVDIEQLKLTPLSSIKKLI